MIGCLDRNILPGYRGRYHKGFNPEAEVVTAFVGIYTAKVECRVNHAV